MKLETKPSINGTPRCPTSQSVSSLGPMQHGIPLDPQLEARKFEKRRTHDEQAFRAQMDAVHDILDTKALGTELRIHESWLSKRSTEF